MSYGDIEHLLVGWLAAQFPDVRVCTELPAVLPPAVVQVVRFGGAPGMVPFDEPRVDIDCYGPDRGAANDLARAVQDAVMHLLPGYTADDGSRVIAAQCDSGPSWAPYDNTSVRRSTAAYTIRTANPL